MQKAENFRKDGIYASAIAEINKNTEKGCDSAISLLETIKGWKDADEKTAFCQKQIARIKEERRNAAKKAKKRVNPFFVKKEYTRRSKELRKNSLQTEKMCYTAKKNFQRKERT